MCGGCGQMGHESGGGDGGGGAGCKTQALIFPLGGIHTCPHKAAPSASEAGKEGDGEVKF